VISEAHIKRQVNRILKRVKKKEEGKIDMKQKNTNGTK